MLNAMRGYRDFNQEQHDAHTYYWTEFDKTDPPYFKTKVSYQGQTEFHFTLVYYYKLSNRIALVYMN